MQKKNIKWPYIISLIAGFIMVVIFILGARQYENSFGKFLVYLALSIWPIYGIVILILSHFVYNKTNHVDIKKDLYKSLYLPPIGAIVGVIMVQLFIKILGA